MYHWEVWGLGLPIGNSSGTDSNTPVAVSNLPNGAVQVSSLGNHTCALTQAGGVLCWGTNSNGELGDSTTVDRLAPVPVTGLDSGVALVAAGPSHSCAVKTSGSTYCWGANQSGQLGTGTIAGPSDPPVLLPARVRLPGAPQSLALASSFSCAAFPNGGVMCWGTKGDGYLGNDDPSQRNSPVDVPGLASGVTSITAGSGYGAAFACAVVNGGVKCWGRGSSGQLGNNDFSDSSMPVDVTGLASGVSAITTGFNHACAIKEDQSLWCWGGNSDHHLGFADSLARTAPTQVTAIGATAQVTSISAGKGFTCATITYPGNQKVYCWGKNDVGQLGRTAAPYGLPSPVSSINFPVGTIHYVVSAGISHACLTTSSGTFCWGSNLYGQLGDETQIGFKDVPTQVHGNTGVPTAIGGTCDTTCYVLSGHAYCWGANQYGAVGDGTTFDRNAPRTVSGLNTGVVGIASGNDASFVILSTGAVKAWGSNDWGLLGNGVMPYSLTPVWVTGFERYSTYLPVTIR